MNIPEIKSYEEQAIDTVVSVINRAKEKLGMRLTLKQLASEYSTTVRAYLQTLEKRISCISADAKNTVLSCSSLIWFSRTGLGLASRDFASNVKLSLKPIRPPYAITSEKFINDTIKHNWKLGQIFQYYVRYMGGSKDEISQYYYFEAIFSQPTVAYPIPQATVSVFFTLQDKHIEPPDKRGVPAMWFRIEGHHTDHDIRFVALQADWLLAMLQMKIKVFKRIESIRMF